MPTADYEAMNALQARQRAVTIAIEERLKGEVTKVVAGYAYPEIGEQRYNVIYIKMSVDQAEAFLDWLSKKENL